LNVSVHSVCMLYWHDGKWFALNDRGGCHVMERFILMFLRIIHHFRSKSFPLFIVIFSNMLKIDNGRQWPSKNILVFCYWQWPMSKNILIFCYSSDLISKNYKISKNSESLWNRIFMAGYQNVVLDDPVFIINWSGRRWRCIL
jgi:hypothetical protein